jgi:PPIC-type PPIASE domain
VDFVRARCKLAPSMAVPDPAMTALRTFLKEPFFQFLLIGLCVFGLYSYLNRNGTTAQAPEVIEVGPGRIAQLTEIFSRTWQRPPTPGELDGLLEAFVREEIFYREGRKLGLDRDDTVLRRRLQQKLEFLIEPNEEELIPAEGELEAYYRENQDAFVIEDRFAFEQVFFDEGRRGDKARQDAQDTLASLKASGAMPDDAGDPTILPHAMRLTAAQQIENGFGRIFVTGLAKLEPGLWAGPIRSEFGWHLVKIDAYEPARTPAFEEIQDRLLAKWREKRRQEIAEEQYKAMRENYEISITFPPRRNSAEQDGGG